MEGNGTLLPLLSTDVPERPTVGPRSRSLLVPPSLLEELARLDTKFKRRETELAHQRSELEKERGRFEQAVATREWALQKEDQRLTEQKEAFRASQEQAISVSAYQDARLTIIASGGEPQSTTLETLSKREPNSGLAAAARTLLAAGVPSGGDAAEPTLYVDRDAVPTQLVLEWLRDGNEVLVPLPRAVLQQMKLEAQHWQMESMGGQVAELLGKIGGGADGLNELEWTVGQLHLHKLGQPALCRAAADKLRRWLAHSRERRRTAARVGASVYVTVVEVIEAHATDLHLLISGLGCAVLLGSEPEGRVQMRKVKPRLEGIAKGAKQLAARTMAEVSGPEADARAAEEDAAEAWERSHMDRMESDATTRAAMQTTMVEEHQSMGGPAEAAAEEEAVGDGQAAPEAETPQMESADEPAPAEAPAEAPAAEAPAAEEPAEAPAEAPAAEAPAEETEAEPPADPPPSPPPSPPASEEPAEAEAPADAEADAEAEVEADVEADAEAEAEAPAEAEAEAEVEAPAEAEASAEAEAPADAPSPAGEVKGSSDGDEEMLPAAAPAPAFAAARETPSPEYQRNITPAPNMPNVGEFGIGASSGLGDSLGIHRTRSVASAAMSVRERRELARRLDREVDKLRRVLALCA